MSDINDTNDTKEVQSLNNIGRPSNNEQLRRNFAAETDSQLNPPIGASKKEIKKHFIIWGLSIFISLFPALVIPLEKIFLNEQFSSAIQYLLTDLSLMYVGIVMLATAMNDLQPQETLRRDVYFVFMFVAVAFYTMVTILIDRKGINAVNSTLIECLNVVCFVLPLCLSLEQYIKLIREK